MTSTELATYSEKVKAQLALFEPQHNAHVLPLLIKLFSKVIKRPDKTKYREVWHGARVVDEVLLPCQAACRILLDAGYKYEIRSGEEYYAMPEPPKEKVEFLKVGLAALQEHAETNPIVSELPHRI
jgi:hypothetical protein